MPSMASKKKPKDYEEIEVREDLTLGEAVRSMMQSGPMSKKKKAKRKPKK